MRTLAFILNEIGAKVTGHVSKGYVATVLRIETGDTSIKGEVR